MAKPGLYANIHAKRKRIKAGSGEKMRKKGAKGAPSEQNFKDAAKTAKKSHGGALHGGQKKLDKNKDGKISGADFKMMKKKRVGKRGGGSMKKRMKRGGRLK